uniref:Uncharacterized protein n=1 Tax=Alexandrium monilatum TaxID=311494 RepID=A0A7S4RKV1_9DINO
MMPSNVQELCNLTEELWQPSGSALQQFAGSSTASPKTPTCDRLDPKNTELIIKYLMEKFNAAPKPQAAAGVPRSGGWSPPAQHPLEQEHLAPAAGAGHFPAKLIAVPEVGMMTPSSWTVPATAMNSGTMLPAAPNSWAATAAEDRATMATAVRALCMGAPGLQAPRPVFTQEKQIALANSFIQDFAAAATAATPPQDSAAAATAATPPQVAKDFQSNGSATEAFLKAAAAIEQSRRHSESGEANFGKEMNRPIMMDARSRKQATFGSDKDGPMILKAAAMEDGPRRARCAEVPPVHTRRRLSGGAPPRHHFSMSAEATLPFSILAK